MCQPTYCGCAIAACYRTSSCGRSILASRCPRCNCSIRRLHRDARACGEHGCGEERRIEFPHKKSSSHTLGTRGGCYERGFSPPRTYSFVEKNSEEGAPFPRFLPRVYHPPRPRATEIYTKIAAFHTGYLSAGRTSGAFLPPAAGSSAGCYNKGNNKMR